MYTYPVAHMLGQRDARRRLFLKSSTALPLASGMAPFAQACTSPRRPVTSRSLAGTHRSVNGFAYLGTVNVSRDGSSGWLRGKLVPPSGRTGLRTYPPDGAARRSKTRIMDCLCVQFLRSLGTDGTKCPSSGRSSPDGSTVVRLFARQLPG